MASTELQPSVLLADDDEIARHIYGSFFSRAGWHYDIVEDGTQCVAHASQRNYDVVLTDLMMPGMHGFEVLETLRRFRPSQAIIVVTGTGNTHDIIEAVRKGADDILLKPIDFQMLRNSIERVLSESKVKEGPGADAIRFITKQSFIMEMTAADLADDANRKSLIEKLTRSVGLARIPGLRLQLALQEALANALDHGCLELQSNWRDEVDIHGEDTFGKMKKQRLLLPEYADRKIKIDYELTQERLSVTIFDEGNGFENAPQGVYSKNTEIVLKAYGRGIAIILGAMDEVRFDKNGSQVTLIKYLD